MKRVRCPKCDSYITFDETKYTSGQSLVFKCNECGKEFGIRIGVSKLRSTQKEESKELDALIHHTSAIIHHPSAIIHHPSVSSSSSRTSSTINKSFPCRWATT